MDVYVDYLPLHTNQEKIINESRRFNILKCGRKFGKTTLTEFLTRQKIELRQKVAYFGPTYAEMSHVWDRMKYIYSPIILAKNEVEKTLKFYGGCSMDFWSLDKNPDVARGFEYDRIIIDEAEYISHLKEAWENNLRATLLKRKGDAWFLSTPQFGSTYFKKLYATQDPEWQAWTFTSYDNPHLDYNEIENIRKRLDDAVFRCEYLAEDISLNVNKFIYNFSHDKHVRPGLEYIPYLPVILSFDFNVEPITCLVCQCEGLRTVRILDEFRLMNSDIEELCTRIITQYPDRPLRITGDASGQSRTALKRDLNYYKVIKDVLKVSRANFFVPKTNPPVKGTRVLCNSLLAKHTDYFFSDRVPFLITDIESCEVDSEGGIDKTKDAHQSHLLDCWRYFNFSFLNSFIPG